MERDEQFVVNTEQVVERNDKGGQRPGRPKGSKNKRPLVEDVVILGEEKRRCVGEKVQDFSLYDNAPVEIPAGYKRPKGRPRKHQPVQVDIHNGDIVVVDTDAGVLNTPIEVKEPSNTATMVSSLHENNTNEQMDEEQTLSILNDFEIAWKEQQLSSTKWDEKLKFKDQRSGRKLDMFGLKFITCLVGNILETVGCISISALITCVTRSFEASYAAMYGFCCLPSGRALHGLTEAITASYRKRDEDPDYTQEAKEVLQKLYNVNNSHKLRTTPTLFASKAVVCLQPLVMHDEYISGSKLAPAITCLEDPCVVHNGHVCVGVEEIKNIKRRVYDALSILVGADMVQKQDNGMCVWSYGDPAVADKRKKTPILALFLKTLETKKIETSDLVHPRIYADTLAENVDLATFPLVGYNHAVQLDSLKDKNAKFHILCQYEDSLRVLGTDANEKDPLFVPLIPEPFQPVTERHLNICHFPVTSHTNGFYQYALHLQLLTHRRFAVYHALCVKVGLEYIRSVQLRLQFPLARHLQGIFDLLAKVENIACMQPSGNHLLQLSHTLNLPHGQLHSNNVRNFNVDGLKLTNNEFLIVLMLVHNGPTMTQNTKKCTCPYSWGLSVDLVPTPVKKELLRAEKDILHVLEDTANPLRRNETMLSPSILKRASSEGFDNVTVEEHNVHHEYVAALTPAQCLYLASSITRMHNMFEKTYSRKQSNNHHRNTNNNTNNNINICTSCGTVSNANTICSIYETSHSTCTYCTGGVVIEKSSYTVEFTKSDLSMLEIAKTGHQLLYQRLYNVSMAVVNASISSEGKQPYSKDIKQPPLVNLIITEQNIFETIALAALIPQHSNAASMSSAFAVPEQHQVHLAKLPVVVSLFLAITAKFLPSKAIPTDTTEQNLIFRAPSLLETILNVEQEVTPEICESTPLISITRPSLAPLVAGVNAYMSGELLNGMEIPSYTQVAPKSITLHTIDYNSITDFCLKGTEWQTDLLEKHIKSLLLHSKPQSQHNAVSVQVASHVFWPFFNFHQDNETVQVQNEYSRVVPYLSMAVKPLESVYLPKLDFLQTELYKLLSDVKPLKNESFEQTQSFHILVCIVMRMITNIQQGIYNKSSLYTSGTFDTVHLVHLLKASIEEYNTPTSMEETSMKPVLLNRMDVSNYNHADYNACVEFIQTQIPMSQQALLHHLFTEMNIFLSCMHNVSVSLTEVISITAAFSILKETFAGPSFYSLKDMVYVEFTYHNSDKLSLVEELSQELATSLTTAYPNLKLGRSLCNQWKSICAYTSPFAETQIHAKEEEYSSLQPSILKDEDDAAVSMPITDVAMDSLAVVEQKSKHTPVIFFQDALKDQCNETNADMFYNTFDTLPTQTYDIAPTQSLVAPTQLMTYSQTSLMPHYTHSMVIENSVNPLQRHFSIQTLRPAFSRGSSFEVPKASAQSFYFPPTEENDEEELNSTHITTFDWNND